MIHVLRAVAIACMMPLVASSEVYRDTPQIAVADLVGVNAILQGSIERAIASAQHLLQLVAAKKIVAPERTTLAQKWLFDAVTRLNALAQRDGSDITVARIAERSRDLKAILSAINCELQSSFAYCMPLPEQNSHKTVIGLDDEYDAEEVFAYVGAVAAESEKLSQSMSTAGLTWYNKVYGTVAGINHRYHITSTAYEAAKISAAGLGAAWAGMVLYAMLPGSMKESLFRDPTRVKLNDITRKFVNPENLGGVNQAVMMVKGSLEVATMGASLIAGWSLWGKLGNQLRKVDAFLRGDTAQEQTGLEGILMRNDSGLTLDDAQFDPIRPSIKRLDDILKFLENPALFINAGNRPPKALLLTGGSGNGKTFVASALHGSVNKQSILLGNNKFAFFSLTPDNFTGWGGAAVRELRSLARAYAPCIIFIDEFHNCNLQSSGNSALLSEFLTFLDDLDKENDPNKIVIMLAATNKPELLDQALYRAGRLGERIHLDNPTVEERALMLETFCKKSGVDPERMNLTHIARITERASRSAMNKICNDAAFSAKAQHRGITFDDFYEAVNRELRKHRPEQRLSPGESEVVAAYQAGAALASVLVSYAPELESVTINGYLPNPDEQHDLMIKLRAKQDKKRDISPNKLRYGRIYTYHVSETIKPGYAEKRAMIKVLLAGAIAHEIVRGDTPSYRSKDRRRAFDIALDIVLDGLPLTSLSENEQNARRDRAQKLVEECSREVRTLLQSREKQLLQLVRELKERGMLRVERVRQIVIG